MAIPKPITRVEQYLAHISGMRVNVPEAPLTREERYLAAWAKKSGIEDAEIQGDPPLTLNDCIGEPFKGLTLYGKSTQVTTTGAQLLDKDALINGIIDLSSGVIYSNNAWVVSDFIPVSDLSNYCISQENEVFFQCRIGCYDASKNKITVDEKSGNITFCTFSTPEATKYIRIGYSTQLSGSSVDRGNIMLNAGDTALHWEPYTGGKPSPSPDYPQEIQSAKSEVAVHGKNLFGGRFYYARYSYGILFIENRQKNEEVKFPYQPVTEASGICKALKCRKGKTYIISVTNPNKNAAIGIAEYETIEKAIDINNALGFVNTSYNVLKKSYIAKSDGILVCGIAGTWTDGKTTLHECTESELLQVEEAMEATSYEPYHELQSMSVTTPNGLPGIPVSSGGNYTDDTGQQWICDEVDMERGVYVQRVYSVIVDGVDVVFSQEGPYCNINLRKMPSAKAANTLNQRAVSKGTFTSEPLNFNQEYGFLYLVKEDYAEILNESCRRHNGEVIYALATPIETQLSETDIAAYRALTTYRGTTILESECGLKVKYSKLRK